MKTIIKYFPFAAIIALNVFAEASGFRMRNVQPFVLLFTSLIAINFVLALALKVKSYFLYGITGIAVLGALSVFLIPDVGQFYIQNVIASMYFGLFVVAAFPPMFKLKPFTIEFSKNDYPEAVVGGEQFLKINLIINYFWAMLFASAIVLTVIRYHSDDAINTILSTALPIVIQLSIGLPATKKLPNYLMQKVGGKAIIFQSIKDLFQSMPYGLNKEKAKGVNSVLQFYLTGKEPCIGYLVIKDQQCTYSDGEHANPKTIIHCDSELWLKISNNEVSGDKALINGEYDVKGDASILLTLANMFAGPQKKKRSRAKTEKVDFTYKKFEPNKIKNIVVFDGGYRNIELSKTSFMVNNFIEGAKEEGAHVYYHKLKDYKINDCTGCYNCWTKTPGECIFKDDMTMLRKKYREADLVVFASPLYIFNVTGIFKTFMDRLLPLMKPYMDVNSQGDTIHPDRFPNNGEQGFVVFSAAGFPEVTHNFDGLKGMFKAWNSHNENMHLMGEFYMTAAEIITQPVYVKRKEQISSACKEAGRQIIEKGFITRDKMLLVQDPTISKETFQDQANAFWGKLDGKKAYKADVPKLY